MKSTTVDFDNELLAKFLIEELTPEEMESLIEWRNQSSTNEKLFLSLVKLRISHRYLNYNNPDQIEKALHVVSEKIGKRTLHSQLLKICRVAAVFILLFSLSFGGWYYFVKEESYVSFVVKESEDIKKVSLTDGTSVWLNSGSTLRVPQSFTSQNRKVCIKGEVYFDVKKNSKSPFIVETDYINLHVLGTSFSIKTDVNGKAIETILVTGKVLLQDKENQLTFEMTPGEKVTFTPDRREYIVETVDVNVSTAWHLDQLTFDNLTLREIANKLSALYNVNVNLESKKLADRSYRFVINRDESLVEVLEILNYLIPIRYRIEGSEVFISE